MTSKITRRLGVLAAAVLTVLAVAAAVPAAAAPPPVPTLSGIRTGAHPGYDRVVLDMALGLPHVTTRNVTDLTSDGSGQIFWLTGEFFTQVVLTPATAHRPNGSPAYGNPDRIRTHNLRNVMAVAVVSDYEGYVTIGLGLRHRSPIHVFTLNSPRRVVIDVKT